MIFYDGYDISAGGPGTYEIFDEEECAKKCIETIGCRGFTMVPNEPYKGCHLKENFGFRDIKKHSRPLVSGVLCDGSKDKYGKLKIPDTSPGKFSNIVHPPICGFCPLKLSTNRVFLLYVQIFNFLILFN